MPRLAPAIINYASRISRYLPLLLRECRDIHSAQNELRWLREFLAEKQCPSQIAAAAAPILTWSKSAPCRRKPSREVSLRTLVERRARGEPLQYILGTQPFGHLDILCRPNVLIPRLDTETYTAEIAGLWQALQQSEHAPTLSIADFCSGTGCISLLLHSILNPPTQSHRNATHLCIRGFDISEHALTLARDNLKHNLRLNTLHETAADQVRFEKLDLLALCQQPAETIVDRLRSTVDKFSAEPPFDIIISNPPYIDPKDFHPGGNTTKSVRKYEPELALVPPATLTFTQVSRADQFYAALLHISSAVRPKFLVMEVGDTIQAFRVRDFCREYLRHLSQLDSERNLAPLIEIWRDDGSVLSDVHEYESALGTSTSTHAKKNGAANSFHRDDIVTVDSTTPDSDPAVECRAVVLWLDHSWISFRQSSLGEPS